MTMQLWLECSQAHLTLTKTSHDSYYFVDGQGVVYAVYTHLDLPPSVMGISPAEFVADVETHFADGFGIEGLNARVICACLEASGLLPGPFAAHGHQRCPACNTPVIRVDDGYRCVICKVTVAYDKVLIADTPARTSVG